MRCHLLLGLIPVFLYAADLKIDHVTVAGTDVKTMQANLTAVGIPSVYGGPHTNKTTEMALVSLPDGSYLELMGVQAGAESRVEQHEWGKFLKANAGPCAWAVREKDLVAEVQRLRAVGIAVAAPVKSGRERPDGVRLDWETSDIGGGTRGTFFPFLIHDFTPRDQRAFPQGKPGTRDFTGVTKVVIAVRNLEDGIARYRKAYGLPAPIKQVDSAFGAQLALLGGVPVILAQPLTQDSWLSQRLDRFGEAPCAFLLGARQPSKLRAASKSRWFGSEVSWFDADKLGWHLGFEAAGR
ncbi:MAG TPA: VOC family protein [Bryobacteraceae bacterium]|nr:VOC family protein [Bryobacteraceae bacterium]